MTNKVHHKWRELFVLVSHGNRPCGFGITLAKNFSGQVVMAKFLKALWSLCCNHECGQGSTRAM